MLPLVLLTHPLPADWLKSLEGRVRLIIGPEDAIGFPQALLGYLPEAEGLLTLLTDRVDAALLARAPRLRVVSNMAVGVDNIDLQACKARGIVVGNTPGVLTDATADLTLALLLSAARRLPQAATDAREGRWKTWSPTGWLGLDLNGATLGIFGMGKIGQAVARRARPFGLCLLYTSPHTHPEVENELGASRVPFETLLEASDILSLHCPLTPETRGVIDEAALRRMKPHAILVNMARGPVVVTEALVRALREGWIGAAALDVTDPEPLPPDHPLYHLSNCLIVPHIGSATWGTRRRMAEMACENLLAGLEGRPLPYPVSL
ncbi:MAG: 2-hydroxyacid dehydrogenase [Anaerolineales bacterium]